MACVCMYGLAIFSVEKRQHIYLLISLLPKLPVKAHGWLPPKSWSCLFKCKGNQAQHAAGIHRARERQMGRSQGKGTRTGQITSASSATFFFLPVMESYPYRFRVLKVQLIFPALFKAVTCSCGWNYCCLEVGKLLFLKFLSNSNAKVCRWNAHFKIDFDSLVRTA